MNTTTTTNTATSTASSSARGPVGALALRRAARAFAMAGFLFGAAISVAANVMHAWLPFLAGASQTTPGLAPQIGAAVWPLALVLSVEILSRVPWPAGWAWQLARYAGAGVVALGAAIISYGHLHEVLQAWGYNTIGAAVGPLVIDGLMTISGFAMLAMNHQPATAPSADATPAEAVADTPPTASTTDPATPTAEATDTTAPPTAATERPERATGDTPRPARPSRSATARTTTGAARPQNTPGAPGAQSTARAEFDRARAEGRADTLTGGALAKVSGAHPGTARKWLAAWRAEAHDAPAPTVEDPTVEDARGTANTTHDTEHAGHEAEEVAA